MSEENQKIVTRFQGHEFQAIDTPVEFYFLMQVFVGKNGNELMARVAHRFPFEELCEGAIDEIVEGIRQQLRLAERLRKKQLAAENS